MITSRFSTAALAMVLFAGCVTIPPEAPVLSSELGSRISKLQDANLALLKNYFDSRRADIDRFIDEEWVPATTSNILEDPRIQKILDGIDAENQAEDIAQMYSILYPAIQARINSKRNAMIQGVDKIEGRIAEKLRNSYSEAKSINNTLTSFLLSASRVTENRNRYLEMIGVSSEDISNRLTKIDVAVAELLANAKEVRDVNERTNQFVSEIGVILDSLDKLGE